MWWNILPSIVIISVSLGLPHLMAPISNWLLVGNFFRRSMLDRELRAQYMRDYRLTGNPYKLTSLDDIPDKTEEEDEEKALQEKEYDRCKALVEERALQEALDRTVKCPRPVELELSEDEEALEKCERQKVMKKKKKAKKAENIVVVPVSKEEKCKKEEKSLCDLSDPTEPPPPGEAIAVTVEAVAPVDEPVAPVDEVLAVPKKCKKGDGDVIADGVQGVDIDGVKKRKEKNATAVVISDAPQGAAEAPKKCKKGDGDVMVSEVDGADVDGAKKCKKKKAPVVVASDTPQEAATAPKKFKKGDGDVIVAGVQGADVDEVKKCKKKKGESVVDAPQGAPAETDVSKVAAATPEERQESPDTSGVVVGEGPKKCKKADIVGVDAPKKCKKKDVTAVDSSADQVNEGDNKQTVVVVDEGRKKSKCQKGHGDEKGDDGSLTESTTKYRSKESAEK